MLGSTAIGGILKIMDQRSQAYQTLVNSINKSAVERSNSGTPTFQFTRRVIALTVTFSVILLPKLAGLFGVPVSVAELQPSSDFLWGLFSSGGTTVYMNVGGVPITSLDTQSFAAIVGLYFGMSDRGRV